MKFTKRNIQRNQKRNKDLVLGGGVSSPSSSISSGGGGASIDTSQYDNHIADKKIHITDEERKKWNEKLDKKTWDDVFTVDGDKLKVKLNIIGDGEITAHGVGSGSGESSSQVLVYDGLDSTDTTIALSANQGRILKNLVDTKGEGTANLDNYYTRKETDQKIANLVNGAPETMDTLKELSDALQTNKDAVAVLDKAITNKADKNHKHTKADITDLDLTPYDNHIADTSKHITSTERNNWIDANSKKHSHTNKAVLDTITSDKVSNWNDANTNKHTHTNKSVLDGIKSTDITNWNGKLDKSVWDKAFYFDGNDVRVKLNLIGDKEVSAYGKGETGSSGAVTIIDSLNSSATDAALSANQGRLLKNMIDNKEVNLTNYYDKDTSDGRYAYKGDIKTKTSQLTNDSGYITNVANAFNYNNLSNKPTIPSNTNQLTNGAGFITSSALNGYAKTSAIPTKVSQLTNDKGYLTSHQSLSNYYTKGEVNSALNGKSNTGHTHTIIQDAYDGRNTTFAYSQPTIGLPTYLAGWNGSELRAVDSNQFWTTADFTTDSINYWNGKANKSDIPSKLPANGGNADTVDNCHINYSDSNLNDAQYIAVFNGSSELRTAERSKLSVNYANSAGGLKEGNNVWTANYSPTNVKNPTWLCGWNASNHTLEAVDRASLSVSYATTAGSTKTITDGTYGMYLADNGYLLRKGNTYLGSSSDRWEYIYCKNLDASGNIRAAGDIIAYAVGDGDTSTNKGIVYDGLDSSDGTIALSANQGRLLNNKITEIDGKFQPKGQFKTINNQSILGNGNINISAPSVDTSKFYNKNEGIVLNTRTIYGSTSLSVNDDFIIVNNSSWANITLPSSAPVGKIIHFKQLTGSGLQFVGGVYDATGNNANWNFQLKKYAHSFYLIHTGGNKWAFFGGW